jgi:hypothetical protein
MRSTLTFTLSALVIFSGCDSLILGGGPLIVGSGVVKTESREVPAFTEVEITSALEATVSIGEKPSVTLTMDDNLLPLVKTEVEGGKLVVRYQSGSNIQAKSPQKVALVAPSLAAIAATGAAKVVATVGEAKSMKLEALGAGRLEVKGLDAESVDVTSEGAGQVELAGQAKRLTLDASGASQMLAPQVAFESARVSLSGASNGTLRVTGSIEGGVSGASSLKVSGNPATRNVSSSGASRVEY